MTNTSGLRTSQNTTAERQMPSVDGAIRHLQPEAAVLMRLSRKLKDTGIKNYEHKWFTRKLRETTVSVNGALTSGATALVVDDASNCHKGMLIIVPATGERVKVTAVAGSTLTIERGVGNSTAGAIADNAVLRIIVTSRGEDSAPGDDVMPNETEVSNFAQHIRESLKTTELNKAIARYGASDQTVTRADLVKVVARDVNALAYFGTKGSRTDAVEGFEPLTGGALEFIPAENVYDAASLTEAQFNEDCEDIFDYAPDAKLGLMSRRVAGITSAWYGDRVRVTTGDVTGGVKVSSYEGPQGTVRFVVDGEALRAPFNTHMFLLDENEIGMFHVDGLNLRMHNGEAAPGRTVEIDSVRGWVGFKWGYADKHSVYNSIAA